MSFLFDTFTDYFYIDLPQGKRMQMADFLAKHGNEWENVDEEKRKEYYNLVLAKQDERLLMEDAIVRKVGPHCTADIRTTIGGVNEALYTLPERAGFAVIAFGAKTDFSGTASTIDIVPHVAKGFCESVLGHPPSIIAMKLEAYMLNGGQAAVALRENAKTEDARKQIVDMLQTSISKFSLVYSLAY